jgi:hypothetical protein
MSITSYTTLQSQIASWLNRNDLTTAIPTFIQLAESRLRRDSRLQQVVARDFTAVEGGNLPSDFRSMRELYLDGDTYRGPILMVSADELSLVKSKVGSSGVPRYAAVIATAGTPTIRYAPEPSGDYTLRMTYESSLDALSDTNATNWLLDAAPDLYLYASLSAAEGYLQEDNRVGLWKQEYEQAANEYKIDSDRRSFGGRLTPRPRQNLGAF